MLSLLFAVPLLSLLAQGPDQRALIKNLRDSVGGVADVRGLDLELKRPGGRDQVTRRLRRGVIHHRLGELTGRREHLDDAIRHFADVARNHPDWPDPWYGIGLAKLELHDQGFAAKEGPYQRIGTDYLHGAAEAFIKALNADPSLGASAERLATTVIRQTIQPQVEEALGPLRRSANGAGSGDTAVQMARGLIEREADQPDSALAAFGHFMRLGGDSAIGLLECARTLSLLRRVRETEEAYLASARLATSPSGVAHLRSDLAWIATNAELTRFDAAGGPARAAWLASFWHRRDVQQGREPGERLAEHYRRLFYVMRHFRLVSEKQQRATLSLVRSPLSSTRSPTTEDRLRAARRRIAEEFHSGAPPPGGELFELYTKLNDQTLLRAYRSDQSVVDDRGVIYMRHGEPWKRATYAGSDADANESWLYFIGGGSKVFHFTGQAASTTLVEQLPLNPELLASRGGLDPRYERMADDAAKHRMSPQLTEQDRSSGREAIVIGTSTDSHPLRFKEELKSVVQTMGVRKGVNGGGEILVVFAARAAGLAPQKAGSDGVIAYPVRVRVVAMNAATDEVYWLDTTRLFATRRVLQEDEFLTGQTHVPVSPGSYKARVVVGDQRLDIGATAGHDSLVVPDFDAAELAMSDLVLGRRNSGQRWLSPPDTVELNPLNAYPVGSTIEVYYQLGGLQPGRTYATSVEVTRPDRKGARVSVDFSEQAGAPAMGWLRRVGLGKLSPGEYLLTVTVKDAQGTTKVTRRQRLNIAKG